MHNFYSGAIIVLMKKIYLAKIPFNYDLCTLLRYLPAVRKEYVDLITDEKRKAQSIFVWLLLQEGLQKDFFINWLSCDFAVNSTGKWLCASCNNLEGKKISFSLSHSADIVAVSICDDGDTGVDVEFVSDKIFCVEKRLLKDYPCNFEEFIDDKALHLTKLWTKKECLFKSNSNCLIKTIVLDTFDKPLCLSAAFSNDFEFDDIVQIIDFADICFAK